jgi:hypothetical protein
VKFTRTGTVESGEVEFDMSADVASPHNAVASPEDYTEKNLAVRLYGEGADNTKGSAGLEQNRLACAAQEPRRPAHHPPRAVHRAALRMPPGPPPALSDADIAKMDLTTARKEWATRKTYVQKNPTVDTAIKGPPERRSPQACRTDEQGTQLGRRHLMSSLVTMFRSLPRSVRWILIGGAGILGYFVVLEPTVEYVTRLNSESDSMASQLARTDAERRARAGAEEVIRLGISRFGNVEFPGDPEARPVEFNKQIF